jgi:hypothetical protein
MRGSEYESHFKFARKGRGPDETPSPYGGVNSPSKRKKDRGGARARKRHIFGLGSANYDEPVPANFGVILRSRTVSKEKHYVDTNVVLFSIPTGGVVFERNLTSVSMGPGVKQRVGTRVHVTNVHARGRLVFPAQYSDILLSTIAWHEFIGNLKGDEVRIMVYRDKQARGRTVIPTLLLEQHPTHPFLESWIDGFRADTYCQEFEIINDQTISIPYESVLDQLNVLQPLADERWASNEVSVPYYLSENVDFDVWFDSGLPGNLYLDVRENCVGVCAWSRFGFAQGEINFRLKYTEL